MVRMMAKMNAKEGPGSLFDGPISLFKSVGIGLQDVAIALAVVEKAKGNWGSGDENLGVLLEGYDKI